MIPSSVMEIGSSAFDECVNLTGVIFIPSSVTKIGENALSVFSLIYGTVDSYAERYAKENGIMFLGNKDDTIDLGKCGDSLVWVLTKDNVLTIYGHGAMYDYTRWEKPWIKYMEVPETPLEPGDFEYEEEWYTLELSEDITYIGEYAFASCTLNGELIIPKKVISIGKCAFFDCEFTGELIIPEGVKSIGIQAFASAFKGHLVIPESVKSIGKYAFSYCEFTEDLIIPGSIAKIENGTFYSSECDGELIIQEGIISIGDSAFYDFESRQGDLIIPEGVVSIGEEAFCEYKSSAGKLILLTTLTNIGVSAFSASEFIGDLIIPGTVSDISLHAFLNCSGFDGNLILENGITCIGSGAFYNCGFTGELVLPNTLKKINGDIINGGAFSGCRGFTGDLIIPENVEEIGLYAFESCTGFSGNLVFEGKTNVGGYAFDSCYGFNGNLVLHPDMTSIAKYAFKGCSGFTGELTLPSNLESIGDWAFSGCYNMVGELVFSESLRYIGDGAFYSCCGLSGELKFPENLTGIGKSAFYGCDGFTGELVIPDGVIGIGETAFFNCSRLSGKAYIPASVEQIGGYAFNTIKTIYGTPGTYAETYAKGYGIKFLALYEVFFDSAGGSMIEKQAITVNKTVAEPPKPVKEGYRFVGWYLNDELYDFSTPVTSNLCLVAKWAEKTSTEPPQASIASGSEVYKGTELTLWTENAGALIYYTVDGSEPTTESILYRGPIKVTKNVTIKAFAVKEDWYDSNVVTFTYTMPETGEVLPEDIPQGGVDAIPEGIWIAGVDTEYTFTGKGGYDGTRIVMLTITEATLMSKVSITKIKNQVYTGEAIEPEVTVKNGKTTLVKGTDYTVSYDNNVNVGKATVTVTGMGNYVGTKSITFNITGTAISKAKVTGIPKAVMYTGEAITADMWESKPALTITANKITTELVEGTDYTINYLKNENKGTATIVFTGIGQYTGTLKKTFAIKAYNIATLENNKISVSINESYKYVKGGVKPEPVVMFGNVVLTKGKDYTVSYKNNAKVNDGSVTKTAPRVIVTGKGNFNGSYTVYFAIEQQDFLLLEMTAVDKTYAKKANVYKSTPIIKDFDGKTLKSGTDEL